MLEQEMQGCKRNLPEGWGLQPDYKRNISRYSCPLSHERIIEHLCPKHTCIFETYRVCAWLQGAEWIRVVRLLDLGAANYSTGIPHAMIDCSPIDSDSFETNNKSPLWLHIS